MATPSYLYMKSLSLTCQKLNLFIFKKALTSMKDLKDLTKSRAKDR